MFCVFQIKIVGKKLAVYGWCHLYIDDIKMDFESIPPTSHAPTASGASPVHSSTTDRGGSASVSVTSASTQTVAQSGETD